MKIFNLFPAPLIRAHFIKKEKWKLQNIQLISINDIPEEHINIVAEFARDYFSRRIYQARKKKNQPFDLAIMYDEKESTSPSDKAAIHKFIKIGESIGFNIDIISDDDYTRIPEFDGLFIRETTKVNHQTFRFAQRAAAEGLVVIDDPESILKCTNKVYLAELLNAHRIPTPQTIIFHKENINIVPAIMNFPIILKKPDSSFSQGVMKVNSIEEFKKIALQLLEDSDLILAQEFVPTDFDWRIGVLNKKPLYACKYFMADNHWQIMNWSKKDSSRMGRAEAYKIEDVPENIIKNAVRSANLIGEGLYGVDIKVYKNKPYLIEINDNPSIETEVEDGILKDELYRIIMRYFYDKIRIKKQ